MELGQSRRLLRLGSITATIAMLLAVALGCGSGAEPSTTDSSSAEPSAVVAAGERFSPLVDEVMARLLIPGAVVLVRTPDYTWEQAFGTRVIGETDPVTVGDHFRVGSNTKTMVGTVVLQLVEEGRLSLDDPVSKYRPEVPGGDDITIAQILDMRSGLYSYTDSVPFEQALDEDPSRAWQPEELLGLGLGGPPYFPPGQGWHYSNTNTVLAGLIIEQITGNELRDELATRILEPLGLEHTSFPAITDATIPTPHPQGYMFGTNVSTISSPRLPDDEIAAAQEGRLQPGNFTDLNPSWGWAAGAAISTAADLATYVDAMVSGDELMDAQLRTRRLDSIAPSDPDNPAAAGYGLAIAQFGPMFGHDGSLPGFQSFMGHDPATGTTLIVLCNLTDGPEGNGGSANEIAKALIPVLEP